MPIEKSKLSKITTIVLLAFVVASGCFLGYQLLTNKEAASAATPQENSVKCEDGRNCAPSEAALSHKVLAYYFHGTSRCSSCYKIESYSAEILKSKFSELLKSGKLEWLPINVEEERYNHFIREFNLHTKSVVLVEMRDGQKSQWKNLEKVWDYLGDQVSFQQYVAAEVSSFIRGVKLND
jgi:hypothetical protein